MAHTDKKGNPVFYDIHGGKYGSEEARERGAKETEKKLIASHAKSAALKKKMAGKMKRMTNAEKYDKSFREGKEPPHARVSQKLLKHLKGEL